MEPGPILNSLQKMNLFANSSATSSLHSLVRILSFENAGNSDRPTRDDGNDTIVGSPLQDEPPLAPIVKEVEGTQFVLWDEDHLSLHLDLLSLSPTRATTIPSDLTAIGRSFSPDVRDVASQHLPSIIHPSSPVDGY